MNVSPPMIYMFEFIVDDLIITHQNYCAPNEYPTAVEFSFRNNVYVNITDKDLGSYLEPLRPMYGKRCCFVLQSPVTEDDRVLIHVYKKQTNRCKFLVGLTEVSVKSLFDCVNRKFQNENTDWKKRWQTQLEQMPRMGLDRGLLDTCDCFDASYERSEQLCPLSEVTKRMVPIFNLCSQQTGNIIVIMRLYCHGPTIVSHFSQQVAPADAASPLRPLEKKQSSIRPEPRRKKHSSKRSRCTPCNKCSPCKTCKSSNFCSCN
ncbi:hypothetical protein KR222_006731 [Zaprionus bogoriensis]|nr:hypothetical protein KR222_006731 [Zaprionus bogoriensis]